MFNNRIFSITVHHRRFSSTVCCYSYVKTTHLLKRFKVKLVRNVFINGQLVFCTDGNDTEPHFKHFPACCEKSNTEVHGCVVCVLTKLTASGINKSMRETITQTWQDISGYYSAGLQQACGGCCGVWHHAVGLLPSFCCSRFAISSLQAERTWLPCVSLKGRARPIKWRNKEN